MDEQRKEEASKPIAGAAPARPQTGGGQRLSAKRKVAAVTRLLRGESLEVVAREMNVTTAKLSEWRDKVLLGAESALKERERDARDEEIARLKAKVGEITMDNELLWDKIRRMEGNRPLARGKSRK